VAADGADCTVPAEVELETFDAIRSITDLDIIVVEPAANACNQGNDLDSNTIEDLVTWREWGDSGAIIVGGGTSDSHDRLTYSNYGSRVDVQGWGENVATLACPPCDSGNPSDCCASSCCNSHGTGQNYTTGYSGTSSAAPMVGGVVAALQSVRLANSLAPLSPSDMRELLIDTGVAQGNSVAGHIGPLPNVAKALLSATMDLEGIGDCDENDVPDRCEGGRACCLTENGPCQVLTEACCDAAEGWFFSNYTECPALIDLCGTIGSP
jgi:hypothetical protein